VSGDLGVQSIVLKSRDTTLSNEKSTSVIRDTSVTYNVPLPIMARCNPVL